MNKEANLEFSIDQSHTTTKMEIPIGNGNIKPRFLYNGSITHYKVFPLLQQFP
jgi:hypothetical protein